MTNINFDINPKLPYLNTEAVKGFFYVQYPSGWSYWQIQNEAGQSLKDGNYTFSQEILAQWTDSDQILIDDIISAAPWDIKPPAPQPIIEEPKPIEIIEEPATEYIVDNTEEAASDII